MLQHVYLISSSSAVKIGISNKPLHRLSALQTSNPEKLYYIGNVGGLILPQILEKQLHKEYAKYSINGEWFDLAVLPLIDKKYTIQYTKQAEIVIFSRGGRVILPHQFIPTNISPPKKTAFTSKTGAKCVTYYVTKDAVIEAAQ